MNILFAIHFGAWHNRIYMSKSLAAKTDPRFLKEDGVEVFTGCELLVKGLLEVEGGTHLWTGYPGSPVAGFFDIIESIREIPKSHGIRATIANNEALAVAMVNGTQMMGLRSIAVMKSVGVHVAADALALGNLAGAHKNGGALIVLGDDPWSDSTQVPADSRFLAKHLFMPVIEPSDPQELKDWISTGFKLSRASGFYIAYLVTTNQADGGGSVRVHKNHRPDVSTANPGEIHTASIPVDQTVLLPPRTGMKEEQLEDRRLQLWQAAAALGVDRLLYPKENASVGFVTSGLAYCYLEHALSEMGLKGRFPILKLGLTYPLDPHVIERFSSQVQQMIVVEERRGFLQEQITSIVNSLHARNLIPELKTVWGKELPGGGSIPSTLGLSPSMLIELLGPVLLKTGAADAAPRVERELSLIRQTKTFDVDLPDRTPSFCPGCPHRDSSSVLLEIKKDFRNAWYMRRVHRKDPVDLLFHGDTGCYTMLMFEPNKELMHNYSGMGLGGATGAGIDPFITNKQVVFMGDSTFFHSGQVSISNSIRSGQDITYVILDNQTTAMTGHQTTPGEDVDLLGDPQFQQNMDRILDAMLGEGPAEVLRVNPAYRDSYRKALEETILRDGVKIIIADKECGITFHRREMREERKTIKSQGFIGKKRHVNITPEVCENCLECTKATGCPGLTFADTPYGIKVQTDLSWCVADTACAKTKACPSFEEVVVHRKTPPAPRLELIDFDHIPEPLDKVSVSEAWHAYLAGVGGMGIGVSTATLVRAGFKEGYRVLFCDKKGLAIRNGGVYSQISYLLEGALTSNVIPYGKADLILGIDVLEAVRGIDPANNQRVGSPAHTTAVLNTEKTPTILTLLGRDDFDPSELEATMQCYTRREKYFGHNFSRLSEKYFGNKLFANVMLLGAAYQRGLLPLKLESLIWAIEQTMGGAARENIKAFQFGRKTVLNPHEFSDDRSSMRYADLVERKADYLAKFHPNRRRAAADYKHLMEQAAKTLLLSEGDLRDIATRVADLIWFDNTAYAKRYLDQVKVVFSRDSAEYNHAATRAVIWNLAKVMLIKDEIFVAHLLTNPEKLDRDRERYDVDPSRGDRMTYSHINRPRFDIGRFKIEFDIRTQNWQLNIMKRLKFLRGLLPAWHRAEREFREWYANLLPRFHYSSMGEYQLWLEILKAPEKVTGYRHIRHPKQERARKQAEASLARLNGLTEAAQLIAQNAVPSY